MTALVNHNSLLEPVSLAWRSLGFLASVSAVTAFLMLAAH
jgi:hypothetical protein